MLSHHPLDPRLAELEAKLADAERFAALVAHELKGRLVTLERFAAGLKSADVERLQSDCDRIQAIARDLVETIDALRSLDRDEAAARDSVSLHQAATDAVAWLKESIEAQNVELTIATDLPTVHGSLILWRHVYRNLIENALKACAGVDRPKIELGCEQRGDEMICFVRDNGCGFQADPRSGTGLGLLLVQRQIERSGGKIWITTNDAGTTVNFSVIQISS